MRGVAEGFTATLQAAQESESNVPYIHVVIGGGDYSDRVLFVEHHEEAYRDRAVIIFRNDDRALDDVDLRGYTFQIGYGHTTGVGDEYCPTADLWVKNQELISAEGQLLCRIYCEGMWSYMREQRVMSVGSEPYYDFTWGATLIYTIIEHILETAMGWTLNPLATSDGIIDTDAIDFDMNEMPYESAAGVLYRLLSLTKCYLRVRAGGIWELIYPQDADPVDKSYYSDQPHYFREYTERRSLTVPNRIVVYCNQDEDGGWSNLIVGDTGPYSGEYAEVLEPYLAGTITNQGVADRRASALLTRIKAETLGGRLLIPHDASVELYDKVQVVDARGI